MIHRYRSTRHQGFTIIELLVVIALILIVLAVVGFAYAGVQTKNRNSDRQKAINALQQQLELYYAQTSTYPTLANINDATWRTQNLKLEKDALQDPRWSKKTTECTAADAAALAAQPTTNCYSYQVVAADGAACDNAATPCAHYTLTASLEGGEKYVKTSLN